MYRLLIVLLALSLASWAFANNDGPARTTPIKTSIHVGNNPGTPDAREGGETIATAVVIPGLPYTDTGNTCDNLDDYEEVCPYSSTSPDVVYSYTPTMDEVVAIDLCLSTYDTKVFVYDSGMSLVGCNDDYYFGDPPECWIYSSYLEVTMLAGNTYYIVVDGYGGDCGDYVMDVTGQPYVPCNNPCSPDALPEDEPPLSVDYVDNYNGGCNSTPNVFQEGYWIDQSGCMHLNGVSGWYPYLGSDYRDTDWYQIVAAGSEITVTIWTDNTYTLTRCMMTSVNPSCAGYSYSFQDSAIPAGQNLCWTVPTTPGGTYWVFVAPADWITGPLEFNYCLEICGIQYTVIPTENASWGEVKSLYK
jgi:hypothetical protein